MRGSGSSPFPRGTVETPVDRRQGGIGAQLSKIFFYGLFMDHARLTERGLHPASVGPAVLHGYRIHIGERATLRTNRSSRAYGIVMELADEDIRVLYSEPSVRAYERERVQVELLANNATIEAYCYILPRKLGVGFGGTNPAYAIELARLVEALRFDSAYVREVAAFAEGR